MHDMDIGRGVAERRSSIVTLSKIFSQNIDLLEELNLHPSILKDIPELCYEDPPRSEDLTKLALVNLLLSARNKKLKEEMNTITSKYRQLVAVQKEELTDPSLNELLHKRIRRSKEVLDRNYVCRVDKCGRRYSSENALNQHLKNKHQQLYEQLKRKTANPNAIFEEPDETSEGPDSHN